MTEAAKGFAPDHAWDRNFFLVTMVLAWVGVILGFGGDIAYHVSSHEAPYLLIVHVHAVAFVGWLVLFTVQIWLIRMRKWHIHKTLGLALIALAAAMIVLGPAAEFLLQIRNFGTPDSDPAFLAVSFTEMLAFGGLVGAALLLRGAPSAHKRLMLMATLYITSAAFARFTSDGIRSVIHDPFWGMFSVLYLCSDVLILGIGAYDWLTRRRLHPVYLPALVWVAANEIGSMWLYFQPFWLHFTTRLLGH